MWKLIKKYIKYLFYIFYFYISSVFEGKLIIESTKYLA